MIYARVGLGSSSRCPLECFCISEGEDDRRKWRGKAGGIILVVKVFFGGGEEEKGKFRSVRFWRGSEISLRKKSKWNIVYLFILLFSLIY